MDAGTQTIEKLFESSKQIFAIPTFQRPYVWKLETQWAHAGSIMTTGSRRSMCDKVPLIWEGERDRLS